MVELFSLCQDGGPLLTSYKTILRSFNTWRNTHGIECPILGSSDERLVVSVNHSWGDGGGGADLTVVGVGLPENNAQSEGVNDVADSVVNVAVRQVGVTPTASLIICIWLRGISNPDWDTSGMGNSRCTIVQRRPVRRGRRSCNGVTRGLRERICSDEFGTGL